MTPEFRLPADLNTLDQWPVWCRDPDTEVPYQTGGRLASSTNSAMWATYETALAAWRKLPKCWLGIEFVAVKKSHLTGTDLDDSFDVSRNVKAWASGIGERFADSYCGISPSGKLLEIQRYGKPRSSIGKVVIEAGNDAEFHGRSYLRHLPRELFRIRIRRSRGLLGPCSCPSRGISSAGDDLTDDQLADELACRVMGWRVTPDRCIKSGCRWIPRCRFQPAQNLVDAFRLLEAGSPQEYTIYGASKGNFRVQIRNADATGDSSGTSKSRTITCAIADALGIDFGGVQTSAI